MEQIVSLSQMLEARECRARRQQELLSEHHLPLVSFTMNIAGPVKSSPLIRQAFLLGRRQLIDRARQAGADVAHAEEINGSTGCEGLYVLRLEAAELKRIACSIEDGSPLGRLFDLDVLTADGQKLDRPEPRRCLICGQPAKVCARSRAHSVPELQAATDQLLRRSLNAADAKTAAELAVRSLLYEVCVSTKPGLVDRFGNGSHQDMDIYSFLSSSAVLWPYFEGCVLKGRATAGQPAPETLTAIRPDGLRAEADMLRATGGANTHKGAIYSMGLICAALGRLDRNSWPRPDLVLQEAARISAGSVERELKPASAAPKTAGQRIYAAYGIAGVRGEAEAGFPSVLRYGLPTLERGLHLGKGNDRAGTAALLTMLCHTPDTNMIARGGMEQSRKALEQVRSILADNPYPEQSILEQLDRSFMQDRLSPGGSADLLALCWMLHFLKKEADSWYTL